VENHFREQQVDEWDTIRLFDATIRERERLEGKGNAR